MAYSAHKNLKIEQCRNIVFIFIFSYSKQQIKEMHVINQIREEILEIPTFHSDIPVWDFADIICDMLHQYAEMVY